MKAWRIRKLLFVLISLSIPLNAQSFETEWYDEKGAFLKISPVIFGCKCVRDAAHTVASAEGRGEYESFGEYENRLRTLRDAMLYDCKKYHNKYFLKIRDINIRDWAYDSRSEKFIPEPGSRRKIQISDIGVTKVNDMFYGFKVEGFDRHYFDDIKLELRIGEHGRTDKLELMVYSSIDKARRLRPLLKTMEMRSIVCVWELTSTHIDYFNPISSSLSISCKEKEYYDHIILFDPITGTTFLTIKKN